jgi:pimeloyl-ACP methyl ester carboxylesterase
MERVDVDGMRIAYTGAGVGPLLVLLHGAPCDSRMWQWMLPDLSRDHTVLAWGAPGFGESSDIDDRWQAPHSPTPSRPSLPRSVSSGRTLWGIRSGRWSPSRCSSATPRYQRVSCS